MLFIDALFLAWFFLHVFFRHVSRFRLFRFAQVLLLVVHRAALFALKPRFVAHCVPPASGVGSHRPTSFYIIFSNSHISS
jgi:hypothetical protein